MPILYSVISRDNSVLADYASCIGNFIEVVEQILPNVPPDDHKLTYKQGKYLFNYICENRVVYMCITDDTFERTRAFLFLNEIKWKFLLAYGPTVEDALGYSTREYWKVIAAEMKHYSESEDLDTISGMLAELDEFKNIDNVEMREDQLDLLIDETTNLINNKLPTETRSRNLIGVMKWKNVKIFIIIVLVHLVIIYFLISLICGGLTWKNCVHKK